MTDDDGVVKVDVTMETSVDSASDARDAGGDDADDASDD